METGLKRSQSRLGTYAGAVAALLGAMSGGCGVDAPSTYHDYALQSAQVSCERAFRCCGRRCSTAADTTFNSSLKSVEFSLAQGLITFNAAQAKSAQPTLSNLRPQTAAWADPPSRDAKTSEDRAGCGTSA